MNDRYIVLAGDPVDGLTFTGPFDTAEDASQWAEDELGRPGQWWVAPLEPPTDQRITPPEVHSVNPDDGRPGRVHWVTVNGSVETTLEVDVSDTPRDAAEQFWAEVCRWVHDGYRPVIEVTIEGVHHEVDLEDEG